MKKFIFPTMMALVMALPMTAFEAPAAGRGAAWFAKVDTDGSGELSYEEFININAERKLERKRQRFASFDTNNDGVLSFEEFDNSNQDRVKKRQQKRFNAIDTNGDGSLSVAELKAARDARRAKGKN